MDYIDDLKLFFYEDYANFIKTVPQNNIYYVTRYANRVYSSFDFSSPINDVYLMFGRESTGIPYDILRNNIDKLMRIPMVPAARSLNVSNCVALVTYEVLRQQNFPSLATEEAIKGPNFLFKK
jgi:tRNA (cytidine/uridine-2'-O-)-methyltransferase